MRPRRSEAGAVTALLIVFAICLVLAISAVTDVSGSYLRRQSALSLADGAALSASDAAAAVAVYGHADDDYVAIDEPAARHAVDAYLHDVQAYASYPGLVARVTVDRFTVTVVLTVPYKLPIRVPGADGSVDIHVTSSAEMPIY